MALLANHSLDRPKPLFWVASSKRDLRALPRMVQKSFGHALLEAQRGGRHEDAKVLKGFGGGGVLELVENYQGSAYRAVYTVRFAGAILVLHVFQKKSKRGKKTPKPVIDLIRERLRAAKAIYEEWRGQEENEG
jgi:phage-related protein